MAKTIVVTSTATGIGRAAVNKFAAERLEGRRHRPQTVRPMRGPEARRGGALSGRHRTRTSGDTHANSKPGLGSPRGRALLLARGRSSAPSRTRSCAASTSRPEWRSESWVVRKWCDECQTLVEPVLRPAEMEREGGSGQERSAAPLVETCPHDPGTWLHFLSEPDE
jgi:hypothetical protein